MDNTQYYEITCFLYDSLTVRELGLYGQLHQWMVHGSPGILDGASFSKGKLPPEQAYVGLLTLDTEPASVYPDKLY